MKNLDLVGVAVALSFAASTTLAVPITGAAACNSTLLHEATDAYVSTQAAGKPDSLTPYLSSSYKYRENNEYTSLSTSIIHKALKIDHRRTNTDLVQCATYSELISASDAANPYVIGTQLWLGPDGKIALLDSIVSTTGAWLFDAKKTLQYVQQEAWEPLPETKRGNQTRASIQAAGDAYMDMWSSAQADKLVPWGTPCVRLEGSAYTGKGRDDDSCKPGIPSNHSQAPNTDRRYVIDEAMGSVSIFCVWQHMMNAADSHEFRLESGKLRFVHTMTSCGNKTCKL